MNRVIAHRTEQLGTAAPTPSHVLQRGAINPSPVHEVPPIVHEVLRSPGQPLDAVTRAYMEPRFGHDFSGVRMHTDEKAAESARAVNALAFTVGRDVVFGAGQYAMETNAGKNLIAHELMHVIQQGVPSMLPATSLSIDSPDSVFEQRATQFANRASQNSPSAMAEMATATSKQTVSAVIQRQGSALARQSPFGDEPTEMRQVLEASFAAGKFGCANGTSAADCYGRLDAGARLILKSLYNRLTRFGLWSYISYAWGIWTRDSGGAQFVVKDSAKFLSALVSDPRFCLDTPLGGLLHKGSTSVREISDSDSLHLSLGSGNSVSAHIDKISPAIGREASFRCRYDPIASAAHLGREVMPSKIPGLQIFPEPRPTHGVPDQRETPPDFIRLEIRF